MHIPYPYRRARSKDAKRPPKKPSHTRTLDLPIIPGQTVRQFLAGDTLPGDDGYPAGWLGAIRATVRPRTFTNYECYARLHVLPAIGDLPLAALSPDHLRALYRERSGALSPATIRRIHRALHLALGDAARCGAVPRNVAALVDPPWGVPQDVVTLTLEEARRLLEAAAGDRLEALYVLALRSGLKQGELLALRWKDVDLERARIRVSATLQRVTLRNGAVSKGARARTEARGSSEGMLGPGPTTRMEFREPRPARGRKLVALTRSPLTALIRHRERQAAERVAAGQKWEDNDLVFPNAVGRPMDAGNLVRRSFKPLLRRAGLREVPFKALRDSAATLLLARKVNVKLVADMLGHSRFTFIYDKYCDLVPRIERDWNTARKPIPEW